MRPNRRVCLVAFLVCLGGSALLSGCGKKDLRQCDLRGAIRFAGKPVPAGSILFEPDTTRRNHGPQGFASIRDGQYDTHKSGRGVATGPVTVTVFGFDGVLGAAGTDEQSSPGKPLFPPYTTRAEISPEKTVLDFEVPAAASR